MQLQCSQCGVTFQRDKYKKSKSGIYFCSRDCQYKHQQEKQSDELTDYRRMYMKAAQRAKRNDIQFDISTEDIKHIWLSQDGKCNLTGEPLKIGATVWEKQHGYTTASLDRVNSASGYTVDNVQIVHKDVNQMKWNMDQSTFIHWCHRVASHNEFLDYVGGSVYNGPIDADTPF